MQASTDLYYDGYKPGTLDTHAIQMQEEMVRNVLNYLYTMIVYMLAVSLVLTAGSRIRRFLDAFDDVNELDLGEQSTSLYSGDQKDNSTRRNPIKRSGVKGKTVDESASYMTSEFSSFLERVLVFLARQHLHDGEI